MRPPARAQAAIEILDQVIAAARENGAAADTLIQRYFAQRRYAGSKDRAAVRELVYAAIRFSAEPPVSGRAALLGLAETRPEIAELFDGSPHAPAPPTADEPRTAPTLMPGWLAPLFTARFGEGVNAQARALANRAPLDLRVNPARAERTEVATALHAVTIAGLPLALPHALRLDAAVPGLDKHPLFLSGGFEVQDAGSQLAAVFAAAQPGETVVDLCAGAGGKTLALAAAMQGEGRIIATDTDRGRLQAMLPRLERAGVAIVEPRLLNPGHESEALADLEGTADLVLIDAPCSGTGTWRRNPELRWRLTPERLEKLIAVQARLITIGARLLKPGGRLVYIVCSVLHEEGARQASGSGLNIGAELALTPATHGTDGFYAARLTA